MKKARVLVIPEESGEFELRRNLPEGMVGGEAALVQVTVTEEGQPVIEAYDYAEGQRFLVVKVGQ